MDNISVRSGSVEISLSSAIYTTLSIKQAMDVFSDVAEIEQREEGQDMGRQVMKFKIVPKDKQDLEKIGYEFCNYLIGLVQGGQA